MNLSQKKKVRTGLKWLLALIILGVVFRNLDTETFIQTLSKLNAAKFFLYMSLFVVCNFMIDSWSVASLARNLSTHVKFSEIVEIRGKTYLLSILHQTLGLGGLGFYIKKKYQLETAAAGSIVLLLFAADAILLSSTGLIFFISHQDFPMYWSVLSVYIGMISVYSLILFLLIITKSTKMKFLRDFSQGLRTIRGAKLLEFFALRFLYILSIFIVSKFTLELFQASIPFTQLLAGIPIAIAVGFLPITPFAIGTYPAALGFFMGHWAPEESLVAFGLCYIVAAALLRIPVGLFYWHRS